MTKKSARTRRARKLAAMAHAPIIASEPSFFDEQLTATTTSQDDSQSPLTPVFSIDSGPLDEQPTATILSQEDSRSLMTLVCSACRAGPFSYEGFRDAIEHGQGYCYTTTWSAISQSINKNACGWCRIVEGARDRLPLHWFNDVVDEESVEVSMKIWRQPRSDISIIFNGNQATKTFYDLYANSGDPARNELQSTTLPRKYMHYPDVLECIKQCNDHEHCPTIEETNLPTRVIDCSDPLKPRLIDTQRNIRGYYCALSYVWGGNQPQKTTTSNIDTYVRDGITVPLPQTITDAISVTSKLGIRYLWVDALCIIQDSSEDKVKELGIMAQIYRDAYLTISARSARSADQGFLPLDEYGPYILPFLVTDRSKPPGRMLLSNAIKSPYHNLYPQELDKRGWCLQESLLSPRKLIFHPDFYIEYECRSYEPEEVFPTATYQWLKKKDDHILFPTNKNHDSTSTAEVDVGALYQYWRKVLTNYSKRETTVPSDKFAALSSVVEIFQPILNDQYIAGLWRRSLLRSLLWEIQYEPLSRPLGYRAPSWSWASVDGMVDPSSYFESAATYKPEILAWDVTPKISTLPFGEITNASLTMKVKIHPLRSGGEKGKIKFDCLEETDIKKDLYFIVFGKQTSYKPSDLFNEFPFYYLEGLIVLPTGQQTEQYRRVGRLSFLYSTSRVNEPQFPDWFDTMPLKRVTLI